MFFCYKNLSKFRFSLRSIQNRHFQIKLKLYFGLCNLFHFLSYDLWLFIKVYSLKNAQINSILGETVDCIQNATCVMGCPIPLKCRPSCANRNPKCPPIQCLRAQPNCVCPKGFLVGPNGRCIRQRDCPPSYGASVAGEVESEDYNQRKVWYFFKSWK